MSTNVYDIAKYKIDVSKKYMLDTNVLINIYYNQISTTQKREYVSFYQYLKEKQANILVSSIQISEFINRCIRFQYDLYKRNNREDSEFKFKNDYRATDDYRQYMEAILDIASDISNSCTCISDNFNLLDKTELYNLGISYDFNDKIIAMISKAYGAVLITDDSDYLSIMNGLTIVTSNSLLLKVK